MTTVVKITCNLNCICVNTDCSYKHFIQYKDRKIVKKFYDDIYKKNIEEPNNTERKKNCIYGQLCENKNCGFRHRLNFSDREKLIVAYKFNKICPEVKATVNISSSKDTKTKNNDLHITNLYTTLEDFIDINDDHDVKSSASILPLAKSWVSIVKTEKHVETTVEEKEEDLDIDDGFYMKF